MKKTRKLLAVLIILTLLMGYFVTLLNSAVYAESTIYVSLNNSIGFAQDENDHTGTATVRINVNGVNRDLELKVARITQDGENNENVAYLGYDKYVTTHNNPEASIVVNNFEDLNNYYVVITSGEYAGLQARVNGTLEEIEYGRVCLRSLANAQANGIYTFELEGQPQQNNNNNNNENDNNDGGNNNNENGRTYTMDFHGASYEINGQVVTATVQGATNYSAVELEENTIITLTNYDPDTMEVSISEGKDNGYRTRLQVINNQTSLNNRERDDQGNLGGIPDCVLHFEVSPRQNSGYAWDGDSVYFVWATEGEANNFYYHKITNINDDGSVNWIPVSTIIDDTNKTTKYNITNRTRKAHYENEEVREEQSYFFVWTAGLEDALMDELFGELSTTEKLEYLFINGMTVNPIGALDGENSVSTMGDLAFKLTIYNDEPNKYEGIKVGVPSEHTYYPEFWDQTFHCDIVDVSKTTKDNPMVYEAFALEETLQISSAAFSRNINSVTALDVPSKAVTITKNVQNGNWNIKYNSKFYNNVEFELTDTNGQKYYLILARINVKIKGLVDSEDNSRYAAIYYPSTDSCQDYKVVYTIKYKNGTTETKVVETPNKGLNSENGDFQDVYEFSGGENLKTAWYKLEGIEQGPNSQVESFYVTVVKESESSTVYGGTLAGSGMGIQYTDFGNGFEQVFGLGEE